MLYLLLSILSSAAIVVIFKYIGKFKVNTFSAIIINYVVATIIGLLLNKNTSLIFEASEYSWIILACLIGAAFIIMFYVIGMTAQKVGVSVTSVAGKMSVIIPMFFSILYYHETVSNYKVLGIILAVLAVGLTIAKKAEKGFDKKFIYLPVILFIGSGIVDSSLKLAQQDFIRPGMLPVFSAILFAAAGMIGIVIAFFKKEFIKNILDRNTLVLGSLLGLANYGSLYFFINALSFAKLDSSLVYGINNIGIVATGVLCGLMLFKERLTKLNWVGVILSFIAIWILFNTK